MGASRLLSCEVVVRNSERRLGDVGAGFPPERDPVPSLRRSERQLGFAPFVGISLDGVKRVGIARRRQILLEEFPSTLLVARCAVHGPEQGAHRALTRRQKLRPLG